MDINKTCYLFFDFDCTITVEKFITSKDGNQKKIRTLPPEHVASIRAAAAAGHKIFICTGRSRGSLLGQRSAYPDVFELPWNGMICGGSDMWYEGERLGVSYIPKEECFAWLDYCRDTGRALFYNATETSVRFDFDDTMSKDQIDEIYNNVNELLKKDPMTNFCVIPAAGKDAPRTELSVISLPTYNDIYPKGCTKGTAIREFCRLLNIPFDQTVCFGDSANDIEMFRACGTGVAMKNSPAELKAMSKYTAKGGRGVTEGIEYIFGIK